MDVSSAGATTVDIDTLSQQGRQRNPDWPQGAFSHALEQLNWIFPEEINFNVRTWARANYPDCPLVLWQMK
jgi:hypothetical protein